MSASSVDVRAAPRAHGLEVVAPRVHVADRHCGELRPARRNDHAAADPLDQLGRLALGLGRHDRRPPVAMIPYRRLGTTYPREPLHEADEVDVGGESDKGSTSRGWYGRNHTVHDVQPLRQPDDLRVSGAEADDDDPHVVEVAKEGRRPHEHVEVLCVADVPRVHDDERSDEPVLLCPLVVAGPRRRSLRVDPVGYDADALGRCALLLQSEPHRVADRHHTVGALEIEANQPAQNADEQAGVERPTSVAISGKTSCEMTSSGTPNRLATARPMSPTIGGSVMQRTMSGADRRYRRRASFRRR